MQLKNYRGASGDGNFSAQDSVVNDAVKKYGGMDEDALIKQLVGSVQTARENGTYDPKQMQSYAEMLSPHLSDAQKEKLKNIIEILNGGNA
jgi:hypothetical protein